jgi:hypothetical protein
MNVINTSEILCNMDGLLKTVILMDWLKCHIPNLIFIENSQNLSKSHLLGYNQWQKS